MATPLGLQNPIRSTTPLAMSDFDEFVTGAAGEAAAEMADPISFGSSSGKKVACVFDSLSMNTGLERYGDTESITAKAIVALGAVDKVPPQKTKVYRHKTGQTYHVVSVDTDAGHIEFSLRQEGAKQGNS